MVDYKLIGARLKRSREAAKLTQEAAAEAAAQRDLAVFVASIDLSGKK